MSQPAAVSSLRSIDIIARPKRPAAESAFETVLDAVNPLQQVPGVGQAYRAATGDTISNGSQLAGHVAIGAALGGPIGAAMGAGVFVLEKALPGVFNFVGKLFSGGKTSNSKADMPQVAGEPKAAAATPRRPLVDGLDVRPGQARRTATSTGPAMPTLSGAQFDLLLSSLGGQTGAALAPADVTGQMQANLEKYRKQQQRSDAQAAR